MRPSLERNEPEEGVDEGGKLPVSGYDHAFRSKPPASSLRDHHELLVLAGRRKELEWEDLVLARDHEFQHAGEAAAVDAALQRQVDCASHPVIVLKPKYPHTKTSEVG